MKAIKLLTIFLIASTLTTFAQKIDIKPSDAVIKWTANKIGGSHTGEIKIKSGDMELKDGNLVKGSVIVDMQTITNTDIENKSMNQKLIEHLSSDDFFGVAKYPTATFKLTKANNFNNGKAKVSGTLTIKNKTEPITFEVTKQNNVYSTKLNVDRSKFDVRYGSDSFFANLGNKAIDNIFVLNIQLTVK